MKDNIFSFNQNKAVCYGEGPLLIVAGPGSGKTFTLTHRIKYIINDLHADPESVLVMTFSRAAAEEMKERFLNMGATGAEKVVFGTFHSVFYRVLKTAYGKLARNYIFDEESCDTVRFDEMLILTRELLTERCDIREKIISRYKWILIDEFQDIDRIQFDIVKLIAPPDKRPNLTVVGDDDQSIYTFRGSEPGIMMDFEKLYPGTCRLMLSENYRSGSEIVKAAGRLIANNRLRFRKDIVSGRGPGASVRLIEFPDAVTEYRFAAEKISESVRNGRRGSDIAILHRNNMQLWQMQNLLEEYGISGPALLTFHKSKGLEFSEVWIIDVMDSIVPGTKNSDEAGIAEERRNLYVAMTRAKDSLYICWCRKFKNHSEKPSVFIDEICHPE